MTKMKGTVNFPAKEIIQNEKGLCKYKTQEVNSGYVS